MKQLSFKGFYIVILVVFISAVLMVYTGARIATSQQTIINNQKTNSIAIKQYIACLLNLNPTQTVAQIKTAELQCFDNAPQVQ